MTEITLPRTVSEARSADGSFRAGGTDLTELRHRGIVQGPVVDLRDVPELDAVGPAAGGGLKLGALVRLSRVAADPQVVSGYRGVAAAAGGLATPQIRSRATLAGSLLQEVRCWYFRSHEFHCLKKGGATCFARSGDAVFHAALDLGPCIAPHPSTMAMALLAYDAQVEVGSELRSIPALLGDGSDPRKTHAVGPHELVTSVVLPPPVAGEKSAYFRAIHRARAEWPLVECLVRVSLDAEGKISALVLALGGIANRPLRFDEAARACVGLAPDDPRIDDVFQGLSQGTTALPQATYKASLIGPVVRETLDAALEGT
jgi:xanthine dehydrogenase YagS FAD-binding subunit